MNGATEWKLGLLTAYRALLSWCVVLVGFEGEEEATVIDAGGVEGTTADGGDSFSLSGGSAKLRNG